jgi:hypothetical protein
MFGRGVRLTALGGLASAAFVHSSNSGHGSGFSHVQPSSYLDADNAGTGTVYALSKIFFMFWCLLFFWFVDELLSWRSITEDPRCSYTDSGL